MKQFRCTVCGYVSSGDQPPEACPQCKAPADRFVEIAQERTPYAAEHVVGVAAGVEPSILEGLRMNFNGECTEVGMYLAMSRVAEREGYPEVAEAFRRYAFEEADHAARFAELLGECLSDSTKRNLELRCAAEHGACEGKTELAKLAKAQNLDAIHDTVHEMCKDEARHGKVFQGLLDRYFA